MITGIEKKFILLNSGNKIISPVERSGNNDFLFLNLLTGSGSQNISVLKMSGATDNILQYLLRSFFIISFTLIFGIQIFSQKYEGTIIRVIDGDTYVFLTMNGSFTVRMLGIDAPERDQPFSRESSEFLSGYLNKPATTIVNGTDKEERSVGTLFVNGKDINLLSLRGGYSWHYKRYSADKAYAAAEEYAQRNKLKIWSLPNPIPPWSWRQRRVGYSE